MKKTFPVILLTVFLAFSLAQAGQILVIANDNVPKMDIVTIQKIYTGKIITVAGVSVTPVAVKPGATTRTRFLREFLKQDEEKYTAYWTVRRYIGKGAPPTELSGSGEVIRYILSTPGAVGYIDGDELKPGVNVISSR